MAKAIFQHHTYFFFFSSFWRRHLSWRKPRRKFFSLSRRQNSKWGRKVSFHRASGYEKKLRKSFWWWNLCEWKKLSFLLFSIPLRRQSKNKNRQKTISRPGVASKDSATNQFAISFWRCPWQSESGKVEKRLKFPNPIKDVRDFKVANESFVGHKYIKKKCFWTSTFYCR